ncbi:MAG TPA: SUMF1/EgtB/PvdO family nonheme iron enzyme [Candidatus Eremiobacteraeota bacterium]|nr:SUMF1/EgtB/PvdO family nonheme iron enzyme [Candidatus Eremiobacteraeota bacterium]
MPVYCDNCGHQNRDSAKFCQGCGGKIIPTTASGTLQPGVVLNKNYEIKSLIKQGGMGAVYLAGNRKFDTVCAVKELLSQSTTPQNQQYMIDSFEREAKILHRLRHPNIPVVIDYFIEAGRYYLVMDYIEGKDLDTVMNSYPGGIVPENIVIEWSKEILDALDYLHNQNPPVIYRDMKPGNIMLRSLDQKIILIDFGIARTITPGGQTLKTTIGTPGFAPKELFHGQPEVRSDIYSLGATMHCLLTGKAPQAYFDFKPVRNINSKVSEGLEKVVIKALSMEVKDRYGNAGEMKEAILSLSPLQVVVKPQTVITPSHKIQFVNPPKIDPNFFQSQKSYIEPEMVYINGGTFQMGSNNGRYDEKPVHSVTVNSFYMGRYPVTNKEYCLYDSSRKNPGDNLPVVNVSWNDAVAYCKWLSKKTGENYRLPTEAEWEYACRAGTTTEYYWGDEMKDYYCWYYANSGEEVHPVGQKKPNAFGLYDMSGNVWEWCSDWYGNYPSVEAVNPTGLKSGSCSVLRGGACNCDAWDCRSAYRDWNYWPGSSYIDGFRLLKTVP